MKPETITNNTIYRGRDMNLEYFKMKDKYDSLLLVSIFMCFVTIGCCIYILIKK